MKSEFWITFGNYYLISIDLLFLIGSFYFFKLPKDKKANSFYWLPFLILTFSVFSENLAAYTNYNFEFKKYVNALLGNTENPKYNLWVPNIAYRQITTILYLLLIKSWLLPSTGKYINWMLVIFACAALTLQSTGIEPLYLNQPIIAALAANLILAAIGLYFIGLMRNELFLDSRPLRLLSFWQTTILLFTYSITYINSVSRLYIYEINLDLALGLGHIDRILGILVKVFLLVIIISPFLPKAFDPEPTLNLKKKSIVQPNF